MNLDDVEELRPFVRDDEGAYWRSGGSVSD
jgi:hypothetical protein